MSNKSVKQRLVEYMMANGNNFTYTEMIKALLLINKGPNYKYKWQRDRGYYGTNLSFRGYITNGGGSCCVYKNDQGKWSAKMYTKDEMIEYKINKNVSTLVNVIKRIDGQFFLDRNNVMQIEDGQERTMEFIRIMGDYSSRINDLKNDCIKNITKQIKKIK
jgi:hypothetical protein